MKKIIFSLFIVLFQIAYSQKARNVGDFTSVKAYDRINVELVKSDQNKVEINGNNSDVELVNKNGELKIRMIPTKLMQGQNISVTVFYENLNEIQASQGAIISSKEPIESENLNITSNEGSNIKLEINTETLNVKANSGGILTISGTAENQDIVVNSGANFDGKEITSKSATVTTNAGGIAEVFASESINATTRAGGIIDVYGSPEERNTQNVIGGKINFK